MDQATARRPVIGITVGFDAPTQPEYLQLRHTYADAVSGAGGVPVLLPPMPAECMDRLLPLLDGVLLPGGLDVEPARYAEAAHPTVRVDTVLDDLDLRVAAWALDRGVPTLGICRGQQLLNVALGGSLIQDLPSEGLIHPQAPRLGPRGGLAHPIELAPGSRLAEILGVTSLEVNSRHHQAVRRLGRGLRAVAWAPDGVVEGVESVDHPWLLAVQFHPEDLLGFHEPSRRLLDAFVAACARTRAAVHA